MLKYVNTGVVFQEIPDEVTLAINISNCPCHCPGCHSHYLWDDIGMPLDTDAIDAFIERYGDDITCLSFTVAASACRQPSTRPTSTT